VTPELEETEPAASTEIPQLVVLTARSADRLRSVAEHMLRFVRQHQEATLADLAYTLQTGREAMANRLALVVASRDELLRGLEEFLQMGAASTPLKPGALAGSVPMFIGDLEGDGVELRSLLAGKAGEAIVQVFLAEQDLRKLALHWTQGGAIPWDRLHAGKTARKLPLPNYPFARQRYWIAADGSDGRSQSHQPAWRLPHPGPLPPAEGTDRPQGVTAEFFEALSTQEQITSVLTTVLSEELSLPIDEIKPQKNFQDYGADSIAVLKMTRGIEEIFGAKVSGREMLGLKCRPGRHRSASL
jgi:acyl transferase domain-containing protein